MNQIINKAMRLRAELFANDKNPEDYALILSPAEETELLKHITVSPDNPIGWTICGFQPYMSSKATEMYVIETSRLGEVL